MGLAPARRRRGAFAHESCACCTAALARLRAGACARACCACGSGTIPTHARAAPRRTAQIAVEPGVSPGGVRGALATKDIPAGGLIASIPIPLTIHFKQPSGHADLLVRQYPEIPCPCWPLHPPPRAALPAQHKHQPDTGTTPSTPAHSALHLRRQAVAEWLALEARNASSPHAPYLASLPMLTDVHHTLSYENFPPAYLHLLQDGGPLVRCACSCAITAGFLQGLQQLHALAAAARLFEVTRCCCESKGSASAHTQAHKRVPPADARNRAHTLSHAQADHIVDKRAATLTYWAARGAGLLRAGVTLDALRAALITVRRAGGRRRVQPALRGHATPLTTV